MSEKNNKVKYNLKNAHYALLTIAEDGSVSYGDPKAIPGSVSISLDANGEPENFYADGIAYYVINNNMGYEGDLELALIPEDFRTEILKEELDDNGVLIENAQVNWNPLHYSLSLMATRDISVMCFIIVLHPDRVSRVRPMRIPERYRQKHLPLKQHRFPVAL